MKNKGFTLVELLITITLITVISVAAGVGINEMFTRQRENNYSQFIKTITNAGCVYAEVNNIGDSESYVTINELLTDGLLSNKLTNPITKENIEVMKNSVVLITLDNEGKRTCTLQ